MLLVAVVGPVGAGKSTRLAGLAAEARGRGLRVDGFVAEAAGRPGPGRGADAYALRFVGDGRIVPYARRVAAPGNGVPYAFDPAAEAALDAWAAGLAAGPASDVVVLDEFGRREEAGTGLVRLWPAVRASGAGVVVLAVRAGVHGAVAARLAQPFDAVVEAGHPDADRRLADLLTAHADWARVGAFGAGAGGVEVTVGSALHTARVPGRGLVLATTQAVVLTAAGAGLARRRRLAGVALVAAGLKALSPGGGRLRPMLAIAVQGLLFTLATTVLGWNGVGLFAGGALVGAWAALQGLAFGLLLMGGAVTDAYAAVARTAAGWLGEAPPSLATVAAVWALAWGGVAGTAALVAGRRAGRGGAALPAWLGRRADRLLPAAPVATWGGALRAGAADLLRPGFLVPVALVAGLVVAAGTPWAAALAVVLRAGAVGVVLFALARRLRPDAVAAWLRRRGRWGPALALERALGHARRAEREA